MSVYGKVILDSVSPQGDRLTTVEARFHRFVLAEFNTHRALSKNSASSRAIPVEKQINKVASDPAFPFVWASEQPGMQGGVELDGEDLVSAHMLFRNIHDYTVDLVDAYLDNHPNKSTRLHKSLLNRLLEPFMWHTVIVSGTQDGWNNFFNLRCSPLAQPEIRAVADAIKEAYDASIPTELHLGQWHLPYLREDDEWSQFDDVYEAKRQVSVARCARVSYLTHDGVRDINEDVAMYQRLITADPPHSSPMEHVATPCHPFGHAYHKGNFRGWHQLRHYEFG